MLNKKIKYKKTAIEAAIKSGTFIKSSLGKIKNISYKGAKNIVTDVDKKAEEIIIDKILSAFPDHSILSEERGTVLKPRLEPLQRAVPYKWLIDPLDGTTNFSHAFPFFCVSIALERNGKVVLGVVYEPLRQELFYAEAKGGAFLNRKRISVSRTNRLSHAFLATGFAYKGASRNIKYFNKFLTRSFAIRRAGSAALDFCYTACGRFDGYWELDLNPWDCAAGTLIVKEAGGEVTRLDGSRYSHYDKEVLATNGLIHKQMVKVFP